VPSVIPLPKTAMSNGQNLQQLLSVTVNDLSIYLSDTKNIEQNK